MTEKKTIEPVETDNSANELKDLLQRTQANFENFRKQTEKRVMEIREMAAKNIILELLPIIDNFELALKNTENQDSFKEGVKLIHTQLNSILENNHIETIKTTGGQFDPYLHEALLKVESDQPKDSIVEELQRGFTLNGEVIRHAKVKISSGKKIEEKTNPKEEN
ncbi:MAG TPA: nucleotide exchange factor GrpE [Candidatus Nanoarchaeia archaeon]|nr:nucleotide exchange factor GrpE [Candidatus Nanoarchaeia archaeon]